MQNITGEILYEKECNCKNKLVVTATVNKKSESVDITTEVKGDATCWMVADTMLRCKCGRKYRMMSRRAYTLLKFEEMRPTCEK